MKVLGIKYLRIYVILVAFMLSTCLLILNTASTAHAQAIMRNSNYTIQMGNLNSVAGESTGGSKKLNITVGQTAPGLYSGTNYKVRAGFQYISSIIPFSFSMSQIGIDLGTLTPTNPITRTNVLTVSNQSAGGYNITAFENHQLLVPASGALIPDTKCDSGTCSETTSAAWTNTLIYGFGYRCDAVSATNYCASGFSTSTFYKQFADSSKGEISQSVMSGTTGRDQEAQITYKVNISTSQFAGFYTNVITYIATPTY